ncbi:unnamed protein product [Dicrocoelium dendriticum]|nr:unnamed protein product [Dicrocoelium dendriticum]
MDAGARVDVAYLDVSKAFDRLDHRMLLTKRQGCGIEDPPREELQFSPLHSRLKMRVRESVSNPTHLGTEPRLFLVFINDLVSPIASNCLLYTDDIKLWRVIMSGRK